MLCHYAIFRHVIFAIFIAGYAMPPVAPGFHLMLHNVSTHGTMLSRQQRLFSLMLLSLIIITLMLFRCHACFAYAAVVYADADVFMP